MDSTFGTMIEESVRRLALDRESNFAFLARVPSAYAKQFVIFWQQAPAKVWEEYLKSDFGSRFWHGVPPDNFDRFRDQMPRRWELLPIQMKMALGAMFVKKGEIPKYLLSPDASGEELRKYANYEWLNEDEIVQAFSKKFEMRFLNREAGSCYQIALTKGRNTCETRLVISSRLRCLSYFHMLNGSSPFLLIDHAGDTVFPKNWDLITEDNLDDAVALLETIVKQFETSVA